MNLLLLGPDDLHADGRASIGTDRYPPRTGLWPPQAGRVLRVGVLDGRIGAATVRALNGARIELEYTLHEDPPPPLPLRLLLALPRPKMLRRVLRSAAELGIKRIHLLNAARVEKSYWQSPLLGQAMLDAYLRAGLEQACDSVLPQVGLHRRLRPFVEDELPALAAGSRCLIAHPAAERDTSHALPGTGQLTLAIGPEGGFTDFELELFGRAGFTALSLGPRWFRVETALPALVGSLLLRPA